MMTLKAKKTANANTIACMTEALKLAETRLEAAQKAEPQNPEDIAKYTAAVEYRKADLAKQQAFVVRKVVR